MIRKMLRPGSLLRRSFLLSDLDWNDRRMLEVELPAGNGVGTARAIARAYSAFAEGGAELGHHAGDVGAHHRAARDRGDPKDEVLGVPSYFSLGFLRPGPAVRRSARARARSARRARAARSPSPIPTRASATPT